MTSPTLVKPLETSHSRPIGAGHPAVESPDAVSTPFISIRNFGFFYNKKQALFDINMEIASQKITAFIGPSGCGKSTLLRNLNRMNDLIDGVHHTGDILLNGKSIYDPRQEVISLRKRIGMVFQKSNPFPKSIYENIVYSLRIADQEEAEPRRGRGAEPPLGGALGRGEGPAPRERPGPLRRSDAAPLHRPGDRQPAGDSSHG